MKRLTTETPEDNLQAALNLFYIKDYETWVRGYGPAPEYADVSLFDLTRNIVKTHIPDVELPEDDDNLSNMMSEWLMDGIDSAEGVVALLYTAAWAYAELRHKLMRYEDTGLEPGELNDMLNDAHDVGYQAALNYKGMKWSEAEELQRYRELGTIDHLRDRLQAQQDGRMVVLQKESNCDDCPLCCGDCGGCQITGYPPNPDKCRAIIREEALAGKVEVPLDAPKEPAEPEWKRKVMRTFLGGRRSE